MDEHFRSSSPPKKKKKKKKKKLQYSHRRLQKQSTRLIQILDRFLRTLQTLFRFLQLIQIHVRHPVRHPSREIEPVPIQKLETRRLHQKHSRVQPEFPGLRSRRQRTRGRVDVEIERPGEVRGGRGVPGEGADAVLDDEKVLGRVADFGVALLVGVGSFGLLGGVGVQAYFFSLIFNR
jgi:hypothetical protein